MRHVVSAVFLMAASVANAQDSSVSSSATTPQPVVYSEAPAQAAAPPPAVAPIPVSVAPPVAQPLPQPNVQYTQPAAQYVQPQYVQPTPRVLYIQPVTQYAQPAQQPAVQYVQPAPQYVLQPQQPAVQYVQPAPQYVQQVAPYTSAQPNGWPAPPPGYVYMPISQLSPGVQAQRSELYDELQRTETRLGELQGKSLKLGAPITFMVMGYGTMLISSIVALSSFAAAEDIQHHRWNRRGNDFDYDINYDGKVNKHDEHEFRQRAYGFTALAGVGLTVGAISTFRLVSKIHKRRELRTERKSLTEKRNRLRSELDYGVGVTPQAMQFSVQGHY